MVCFLRNLHTKALVSAEKVSESENCELASIPAEISHVKFRLICKFVILRHDKILFTDYAKLTSRKSSKASSKKSAKSFLAKKSAKLPELSRAAVGPGTILFNSFYKSYTLMLFSHPPHLAPPSPPPPPSSFNSTSKEPPPHQAS
jgi:hypothetical protein